MNHTNETPVDRNGKPLKIALLLRIYPVKGPPIFGRLLNIGQGISTFETGEGDIYDVRNENLEVIFEK